MITQTFNLNLIPDSAPVVVHVDQYDVGEGRFVIKLMNGDTPYTPVGATAVIQGMKPDGHGFIYAATISGDTVTADLVEQMSICAGNVRCQLVITDADDRTGTFVFIIAVQKSALPADSDMSTSDYQMVEQLIITAESINTNPPKIGANGNWWIWDVLTMAYVDSGVDASITVDIADITMLSPDATPYVTNTGTSTDPVFHLFIPRGQTGATGAAAGFGTPTASIDNNTGTPSVNISASGPNTAKVFDFAFHNLKGDKGDTGNTGATGPAAGFGTPTASVDANVGTPSVNVTASGPDTAKVFNFAFHNLKGADGTDANAVHWVDNTILGAKNFLSFPYLDYLQNGNHTIGNIAITYYSDGKIKLNGTANTGFDIRLSPRAGIGEEKYTQLILDEGTYIASKRPNINGLHIYIGHKKEGVNAWETIGNVSTTEEGSFSVSGAEEQRQIAFHYHVDNGTVLNDVILEPMIRLAIDTDSTYAPYAMTNRELTNNITPNDVSSIIKAIQGAVDTGSPNNYAFKIGNILNAGIKLTGVTANAYTNIGKLEGVLLKKDNVVMGKIIGGGYVGFAFNSSGSDTVFQCFDNLSNNDILIFDSIFVLK